MKKNIYIIISFFCSITFYAQNISGLAIYKKEVYISYKKDDKTTTKLSKLMEEINDNLKNVEYFLEFNKNESIFQVEEFLNLDDNRPLKLAINFGGGRGIFYTNLTTNEILQQAEGYGEFFLIKDLLDSYNWKITDKRKIIGRYQCVQAVTEIKVVRNGKEKTVRVEAWFWTYWLWKFARINCKTNIT